MDRIELEEVTAFTAGAIGQPGSRTFYLQARTPTVSVSIKCEKGQVEALGQFLGRMLEDLPNVTDMPHPSQLDLVEPVTSIWVLGAMGIAYETDIDRFVMQLEEAIVTDEEGTPLEDPESQGALRIKLTRGQVRSFVEHAKDIVAAGRPPCRWCSLPIDPDGHYCPRMN